MLSRAGLLLLPALREPIGNGLRASPSENRVGSLPLANFQQFAAEFAQNSFIYYSSNCTKIHERPSISIFGLVGLLALVLWCLEYSAFQTLAFRSAV